MSEITIHRCPSCHDMFTMYPDICQDCKIKNLANKIAEETRTEYIKKGFDPKLHNFAVSIKPGSKYIKIDVGTSGKYMVEKSTGNIYGIKAYGVIHRGHQYGTLDTIDEWYWGEYVAVRNK